MLLGADLRTLRVVWTILLVAGALALLYGIRHLLVLIAFSVFVAYVLHPLVWQIEHRLPTRHRRVLALLLTYTLIVGTIVSLAMTLGPHLADEVRGLGQRVPKMSEDLRTGALLHGVLARFGLAESTINSIDAAVRAHAGEWAAGAQRFAVSTFAWLAGAWTIVLVPIFAFFLLANGELVTTAAGFFSERRHRQLWRRVAWDLHAALGQYVRALMLLSLATFVVWAAVLAIAHVPYALVLAIIAALLEFVPLVGPLVAGAIAVVVSMVTGYGHPFLIAGFALVWRLVQDYVTSPLVMGRGIELPPGLVIFAILAGGELAGPVGMFLAVPVVAAARIIWRDSQEEAPVADPAVRRVR